MACLTYYTPDDIVPACLKTLSVSLPVKDVDVAVFMLDKFGRFYRWETEADSLGVVVIDLEREDLPRQLFNEYAGPFRMRFRVSGQWVSIKGREGVEFSVSHFTDGDDYLLNLYDVQINSYYNV